MGLLTRLLNFPEFRRKGFFEQFKQLFYDYYYHRFFSKYPFSFNQPKIQDDNYANPGTDVLSELKDNYRNQPTPYYYIFKSLKFATERAKNVNLLDIGCGDGRVLVSGISLGFNKVFGIDIDESAIKTAEINCAIAKAAFHDTFYQIISQDAARYIIPNEVNVIFLFNPFGRATLESVSNGLQASYHQNPREVYVIYCYPIFDTVFQKENGFEKIYESKLRNETADLIIYKLSHRS